MMIQLDISNRFNKNLEDKKINNGLKMKTNKIRKKFSIKQMKKR